MTAPYPTPTRSRWYMLALLCMLFAVSMVDRLILALLVQPIQRDLGVSDTQLGMLMGAAFALLYSFAGFPIAQLLDRHRRKAVMVAGITLWSLSTVLSGLAHSFEVLFLLRAGVAIGEAVLTPAAVSLIADMFGPRERALPTSIYMATAGFMGTGAFAVGGVVLQFAGVIEPSTGLAPWRTTIMMVGLPGLLLAFLLATTTREPARAATPGAEAAATTAAGLRYLRERWRLFLPFFLGSGVLNIFTMGIIAWFPTFLVRATGVDAAHSGYLFSLAGVPAGFLGSFFWPWVANKLDVRGRHDTIPLLLAVTALAIVPVAALMPFAPSAGVATILAGVLILIVSTNTTLPLIAIQAVGAGSMRGRLTALELLAYNLIGLATGPVIVAWVGERFSPAGTALGTALAVTAAGAGTVAAILFFLARRPYAAELNTIATIESAAA